LYVDENGELVDELELILESYKDELQNLLKKINELSEEVKLN